MELNNTQNTGDIIVDQKEILSKLYTKTIDINNVNLNDYFQNSIVTKLNDSEAETLKGNISVLGNNWVFYNKIFKI